MLWFTTVQFISESIPGHFRTAVLIQQTFIVVAARSSSLITGFRIGVRIAEHPQYKTTPVRIVHHRLDNKGNIFRLKFF